MKQINSTLFRLTFLDLREAHEVTHYGEVIGTFTPRALPEGRPETAIRTRTGRPKHAAMPDLTQRAE